VGCVVTIRITRTTHQPVGSGPTNRDGCSRDGQKALAAIAPSGTRRNENPGGVRARFERTSGWSPHPGWRPAGTMAHRDSGVGSAICFVVSTVCIERCPDRREDSRTSVSTCGRVDPEPSRTCTGQGGRVILATSLQGACWSPVPVGPIAAPPPYYVVAKRGRRRCASPAPSSVMPCRVARTCCSSTPATRRRSARSALSARWVVVPTPGALGRKTAARTPLCAYYRASWP